MQRCPRTWPWAFRRLHRDAPRRLRLVRGLLVPAALLAACETSVVSVVEVAEVEVSPPQITLVVGGRETASAILRESGGAELAGRIVKWTVDDPAVATVGSDGVVEGRAPGSTRIHASSEGVSGAADVTVLSGPGLAVWPESIDLAASSGDSPVTREVVVVNTGAGTLGGLRVRVSGSGGGSAAWLDAGLSGTETPTLLRLRASAERLDEGSYEALVTVESSTATNAAATVSVRLEVAAASEPDHPCDVRDHVFVDDFEIPRNTSCVFANVRVQGKLTLREGASLVASELQVDEDLQADGAVGLTLSVARIDGGLAFQKGGSVTIANSEIGKKLALVSNAGSIDLRDNTIGDDVKLEKNTGGPFILLRNTIDGKLECKDNVPSPIGSGNVVDDEKVEQCREL